ncbi:MAG: putative baseplate assembly protein [Anaerolineales bacterium]|nr:putative baseplate assembly protein [Anaerolineales bacterium]
MGTQYRYSNENRRDAVRFTVGSGGTPILNGIDYLEVVSADQKTLEVHFIHNLPGETDGVPASPALTKNNFAIEGGVRIQGIEVEILTVADNVATLQVSEAGDYSNYVLRLVVGEEIEDPPSGFDPQLSAVTFSFKVECPSDFDCKPEEECPPENLPAPLIDYLAKDYGSFHRLMLDRLATIMPDWREHNPADLQIALVEAVAYVADYLSYYQDAVGTEAYLGTARQRISLRRHARLLDYFMHDGSNARAWVHFEVEPGSAADGWLVPTGTPLLTRGLVDASTIDPAEYEKILRDESPVVFETLHDITLHSAHNAINLYTWDDTECCLPKGATHATLLNDPQLDLRVGDVILFEEVISPSTGLAADADPAHRHAVRLTGVMTENSNGDPLLDPLHGTPITEISWDAEDALPFPLCVSAKIETETGPKLLLDLSVARGNIVLADHGQTIPNEAIGKIGADTAGRLVQPVLQNAPLTQQAHAHDRFGELVRDDENESVVFDPQAPAVSAFQWQIRDTLPAIRLIENADATRPWRPRHDLLASNRFDSHFTVEVDNNGRAHLRFGDGFHAAMPKPDSTFEAIYRVGNGTSGNVGTDSIHRVVLPVAGIQAVRNPLPASGGTEPESLEQVRQYAPQAFRVQERAVTAEDYARVTERHPEVQKAAATLRWTGSWYTVFDTVDRTGGRLVDDQFESELLTFLERFRMAGQDIEVDAPRFVPLEIVFTVCVKPGYYRAQVKADLLKIFSSSDLPDGRRGFFHPDRFTFGQPLYLSQMIALVMDVPGVQWVDAEDVSGKPNRFRRWGKPANGEFDAGKIAFDRLEIPRLDNNPSLPENGRIDFIMEGGM